MKLYEVGYCFQIDIVYHQKEAFFYSLLNRFFLFVFKQKQVLDWIK